jgi:hypothetical protein
MPTSPSRSRPPSSNDDNRYYVTDGVKDTPFVAEARSGQSRHSQRREGADIGLEENIVLTVCAKSHSGEHEYLKPVNLLKCS